MLERLVGRLVLRGAEHPSGPPNSRAVKHVSKQSKQSTHARTLWKETQSFRSDRSAARTPTLCSGGYVGRSINQSIEQTHDSINPFIGPRAFRSDAPRVDLDVDEAELAGPALRGRGPAKRDDSDARADVQGVQQELEGEAAGYLGHAPLHLGARAAAHKGLRMDGAPSRQRRAGCSMYGRVGNV